LTQWLTDLADQAVALPVLLVVGMMLGLERRWSQAACWFAAIVPVLAVVGAVKSLAYACAWLWPLLDPDRLDVRSPSGHTASAAVLYGSLAGLLAIRSRRVRAITLLAAAASGATIGLTRIALATHSAAEVALGLAAGLAGALAFAFLVHRQRDRRLPTAALASAFLVIAIQHGHHLGAEQVIQDRFSLSLRRAMPACLPGR
jgi:membrane-associated phospholipid phosphatase